MRQLMFLFDILVLQRIAINLSQLFKVYRVTHGQHFWKNNGRNQKKYCTLHIDERQIHFYLISIYRWGTIGRIVIRTNSPIPEIVSDRVH